MPKHAPPLKTWVAALIFGGLLCAGTAQAGYSDLVVFGDSYSDSGNLALAYAGLGVPLTAPGAISGNDFASSPYDGSNNSSNGPVWSQALASKLGIAHFAPSLSGGTNYAFGGAFTSSAQPSSVPSLGAQLDDYLASAGSANANAVYVVAGGTNDLRAVAHDARDAIAAGLDPTPIIAQFIAGYLNDTLSLVGKLQANGAQHIIVWDIPDLAATPIYQATTPAPLLPVLRNVIRTANGLLANQLAHAGNGITFFDVFQLQDDLAADPAQFGLINVTDACVAGTCNADSQLFWDGLHWTAATHAIVADRMMSAASLPEGDAFTLSAVALALLAGMRRRAPHRD